MLKDEIEKASVLAKAVGYVLVATSGKDGVPHLCAAGQLDIAGNDCIAVTEWFCPGTIANTDENRNISVVSWDRNTDEGYQLIGTVRQSLDVGVLDGYSPKDDIAGVMPQVEKRLMIDVEKVMAFKMQPHTDKELDM
jgi:hypothetical protein